MIHPIIITSSGQIKKTNNNRHFYLRMLKFLQQLDSTVTDNDVEQYVKDNYGNNKIITK